MKRVLVLSHAGVVEVNRAPFQELARLTEIDLRMIVPERWHGNLIRELRAEASPDDSSLQLLPLPVLASGRGSLFVYRSRLRSRLGGWEPDWVFLDEEPWSLNALQTVLAFPQAKVVFFTKENLKRKFPLPFRWIERRVFDQVAWAYSVADEVTSVLRDWKGFTKPVRYLPHSIDAKLFRPLSEKEKSDSRRALGIPGNGPIVGYVGRLVEEKGIRDLVRAAQTLLGSGRTPRPIFAFIGNGPLDSWIRSELGTDAAVLPAIPHSEIAHSIATLDLLVLPSKTTAQWKEQFGRVLIEALACKVALVGSNSGEIPNLIRRTGGGRIFQEGDVDELRSRITELLDDPKLREELAENGYQSVMADFTHPAVARRIAQDLELPLRS